VLGVETPSTVYRKHLYELAGFKEIFGPQLTASIINREPLDQSLSIDIPTMDVQIRGKDHYAPLQGLNPVGVNYHDGVVSITLLSKDGRARIRLGLDFSAERLLFDLPDIGVSDNGTGQAAETISEVKRFTKDFIGNGELHVYNSDTGALLGRKGAYLPMNMWLDHDAAKQEIETWRRTAAWRRERSSSLDHEILQWSEPYFLSLSVTFHPIRIESAPNLLGAFFDDSGTHASSPAVVIGGLLGTSDQWDAFADAWTKLLESPLPGRPPLKEFHLTHCRARQGEFQDYSQAEIDRITYLFRHVILDIEFITIAVAVNMAAWTELVVGDLEDKFGVPAELCFTKCIELMVDRIRRDKPGEKVLVCVDQGTQPYLREWPAFYRSQPERYPEIESVYFAPVPKVVALQGADMIASETYQYAKECLKNGKDAVANAHFRDYLTREWSVGLLYDREHISEALSDFRESVR
jgi:hypothetical protein